MAAMGCNNLHSGKWKIELQCWRPTWDDRLPQNMVEPCVPVETAPPTVWSTYQANAGSTYPFGAFAVLHIPTPLLSGSIAKHMIQPLEPLKEAGPMACYSWQACTLSIARITANILPAGRCSFLLQSMVGSATSDNLFFSAARLSQQIYRGRARVIGEVVQQDALSNA